MKTRDKKSYSIRTKKKQNLLERMNYFCQIKGEEDKITFIRLLRETVKKDNGKNFFRFSEFIIKNIEDDSKKIRNEIIRMAKWTFSVVSEERGEDVCIFVDQLLLLMEKHYKEEYGYYEHIDQLPSSVYKSLEFLIKKILFSEERIKVTYKDYLVNKGVSRWIDCTWKRVGCKKRSCPVCNRSKKNLFYLHQGTLFRNIQEEEFKKMKEPPPAEEFSLYVKVKKWRDDIFDIAEKSEDYGDFWIYTLAAAELFWYSGVLSSKCYDQFCNRHYINQGCKYIDYNHTKYIIKESVKILRNSLEEIISFHPEQDDELKDLFSRLSYLWSELRGM